MFALQITDSQAETLEYEVAEALQDLITKNAKENMIGDLSMEYPINAAKDTQNNMVRVCDCVSVVSVYLELILKIAISLFAWIPLLRTRKTSPADNMRKRMKLIMLLEMMIMVMKNRKRRVEMTQ